MLFHDCEGVPTASAQVNVSLHSREPQTLPAGIVQDIGRDGDQQQQKVEHCAGLLSALPPTQTIRRQKLADHDWQQRDLAATIDTQPSQVAGFACATNMDGPTSSSPDMYCRQEEEQSVNTTCIHPHMQPYGIHVNGQQPAQQQQQQQWGRPWHCVDQSPVTLPNSLVQQQPEQRGKCVAGKHHPSLSTRSQPGALQAAAPEHAASSLTACQLSALPSQQPQILHPTAAAADGIRTQSTAIGLIPINGGTPSNTCKSSSQEKGISPATVVWELVTLMAMRAALSQAVQGMSQQLGDAAQQMMQRMIPPAMQQATAAAAPPQSYGGAEGVGWPAAAWGAGNPWQLLQQQQQQQQQPPQQQQQGIKKEQQQQVPGPSAAQQQQHDRVGHAGGSCSLPQQEHQPGPCLPFWNQGIANPMVGPPPYWWGWGPGQYHQGCCGRAWSPQQGFAQTCKPVGGLGGTTGEGLSQLQVQQEQQGRQEGSNGQEDGLLGKQMDGCAQSTQGQRQQQQLLEQQAALEKELEQLHGLLVVQEDASSSSSSRGGSRGSSTGRLSPKGGSSRGSKQLVLAWEQAQAVAGGLTMRLRRTGSTKVKSGPPSPVGQGGNGNGNGQKAGSNDIGKHNANGELQEKISMDGSSQVEQLAVGGQTAGSGEGLGGGVSMTRLGSTGASVKLPPLPQPRKSSIPEAVAAGAGKGITAAGHKVTGDMAEKQQQQQREFHSGQSGFLPPAAAPVGKGGSTRTSYSMPDEVSEEWRETYEQGLAGSSSSSHMAGASSRGQSDSAAAGGSGAGKTVQTLSHRRK